MDFGSYIRERRKALKYSLRDLADAAEIDFTYLSKVETGRFPPPSEDVIQRLAKALDDDVDELLAMAKKVDTSIHEFIVSNPDAPKLLRALKEQKLSEAERILEKLRREQDGTEEP